MTLFKPKSEYKKLTFKEIQLVIWELESYLGYVPDPNKHPKEMLIFCTTLKWLKQLCSTHHVHKETNRWVAAYMRQSKYHRDIPNDAQIKMNRYHQLSKQNQDIVDRLINTIASTGNSRLVTDCVQSIIPKAIDKIDEVHRKELNSRDDRDDSEYPYK